MVPNVGKLTSASCIKTLDKISGGNYKFGLVIVVL